MFYKLIQIALLFFSLSSCNSLFFKDNLSHILGVKKVEIESNQTFDDWAGMQGEGYMLEIYILSENTIQEFKNSSLKKLPEKNDKDKNWQKYDWSKNPIDSTFDEIFVMCLNYSSDNQKLKVKIEEIKKLKRKREIYYSFYYRPDKENPQNAQLFILDIQNRKLYAIDQQI